MAYTKEEMEFLAEQGVVKEIPEEEDMDFMDFLGFVTGQGDRPEVLTLEGLQKDLQETLESMYRGILHDIDHVEEATDPGEIMFHAGHAAAIQTAMWVLVDDAFPQSIDNHQRFKKTIGLDFFIVAEEGKLTVTEQDIVKEKCQDKLEAVYDVLHAMKVDATTGKALQTQTENHECRCESTDDKLEQIQDAMAAMQLDIDNLKNEVYGRMEFEAEMARAAFDGDDGIMEHHFLDEPMNDDLEF